MVGLKRLCAASMFECYMPVPRRRFWTHSDIKPHCGILIAAHLIWYCRDKFFVPARQITRPDKWLNLYVFLYRFYVPEIALSIRNCLPRLPNLPLQPSRSPTIKHTTEHPVEHVAEPAAERVTQRRLWNGLVNLVGSGS